MHAVKSRPNLTRLDADDPRTDTEIIDRVLSGESRLFEVLMRRHNERLYRAVRAHIPDEPDVEEIMQDTYLSAFRHLRAFERRAKFSTWLLQIGINRARQSLRTKARWRVSDLVLELPAEGRDPERAVAAQELVAVLERNIDALPVASRAALVLRDVEGLETWEVAEALNLTKDAVRVRLHRARRELRRRISQDLGTLTPAAFRFFVPRCDRVVARVLRRMRADFEPAGGAGPRPTSPAGIAVVDGAGGERSSGWFGSLRSWLGGTGRSHRPKA